MKSVNLIVLALIGSMSLMFAGCNSGKDKPTPDPTPKEKLKQQEVKFLKASTYDTWTYFSLSEVKEVTVPEPEKSADWDIAFHQADIRVNGSKHYTKGKGALAIVTGKSYEQVIDAQGVKWVGNVEAFIPVGFDMKGMMKGKPYILEKQFYVTDAPDHYSNLTDKNNKENTYRSYSMKLTQMPPLYEVNNGIFLIKSADGKHLYKLQIKKVLDDQGKSAGTLTFIYEEI